MIELGHNFLKKDLDKIQRFKNPVLDIVKSKINKNSKYKIFLNKIQFNNLLDQGFIKYKLTDSKKQRHLQKGDGIGSLLSMAFNMIKPALPKIASTIGLSGLSAGVSHGINKALNKIKKILEIDEKTMNQIKQNLKKINDSKVFDRKITLNQQGSGIFSFLLPMLASTIIPSLISGKGVSKNRNFFEVKTKYPSLFERKNYPLSNIFINNLLKNFKHFDKCYSKDQIPLIENNKSLIFNLQNSDQSGSHLVSLSRKNNNIFIFDSFGIGDIPNNLYKIYKNYNIITSIYRIQDIDSNLCGMFCVLFCLYKVDSKNKFISFLNLFNPNNFLKDELI